MTKKAEQPIWLMPSLFFLTILAGSVVMYFINVGFHFDAHDTPILFFGFLIYGGLGFVFFRRWRRSMGRAEQR